MDNVLIVAIPLFDYSMTVGAYRLCDHKGTSLFGIENNFLRMNDALTSPGLDIIERVGLAPFTGGKPLFTDINKFKLLSGAPKDIDIAPDKLICILGTDIAPDADVLIKCQELKLAGYSLAMDGFPEHGEHSPFLQYIDYMILNYQHPNFSSWYKTVRSKMPQVKAIISDVPDMESFKWLAGNKAALFTGDFYSQPITSGASEISPIKINALQLLREVNQDDFDLTDIAKIIGRDPYLTISLLKFINSDAVGLKRKVDSINSAVAILGQQEVRRWATIAISMSLAEDMPGEITKLSLVRAKFAENLAGAFELGVFQPALFMAGLFSLLDVILDKPMDQAIKEVAVDMRVEQALVEKKGDLYPVLELIYAYERADWDKTSIVMIKNDIETTTVNQAFIDALLWYSKLLASIDENAEAENAQSTPMQDETPVQ